MIIKDKIYGTIKIEAPVLLELLKSSSVLRLKNISQFGVPDKYYHVKNFSRYEHSVGVMILLKKLDATLEEQIAGLLHDVSTLAFSHISDWVFGEGKKGIEDYHDKLHKTFIEKTEIPEILKKHNFNPERILDERNFTLLEKSAPDLCVDRVDYSLREFKYWLNPKIVDSCIKGLVNYNNEIVFSDKKVAFDFSVNYLELQTRHWGEYEAMMRYYLFSDILKIAIDEKILSENDFYKDEKWVLNKLTKSKNKKMKEKLGYLENKKLKKPINNSGEKIVKKFRYVDPRVISDGKLIRLSQLVPEFKTILEKHRKINEKGLIV
ncbi:MAG TPA: HD domain-containing protein [Candidatus Pacearchaeota archaeon]|nr:HD domain-containing protein [Candidatus Pacearchaeota archaeon]HOK94331.1 HD domain-containing protein [Candidatus Pacearchaeota archaeon]HPO75282.1 HD domain-containing protein [Candidatus Pacearchaeota archaeon]